MNWYELATEVAARTGLPEDDVLSVLGAAVDASLDALSRGESVSLHDLGRIACRWHPPQIVRNAANGRRLRVDGRWVPAYHPSSVLRLRLIDRTPQLWRDPEHQEAWRIADTLVEDLALYHSDRTPQLSTDDPDDQVDALCSSAFGSSWANARQSYESTVPQHVRALRDYLVASARSRWARAIPSTLDEP